MNAIISIFNNLCGVVSQRQLKLLSLLSQFKQSLNHILLNYLLIISKPIRLVQLNACNMACQDSQTSLRNLASIAV